MNPVTSAAPSVAPSSVATAGPFPPRTTVQPVPAAHPYSRRILPVDLDPEFTVLTDPKVPGAPKDQWWPPRALDADWLTETTVGGRDGKQHQVNMPDVLHVHFGTESYTPGQLRQTVQALRAAGSALVVTVHDLQNPHLTDQDLHLEQLGVLVSAADEVLTLTRCAAAEIKDRWDRDATVVPHPHMASLDQLDEAADRPRRGAPQSGDSVKIGVHAKDLPANVEPLRVMEGLRAAVDLLSAQGISASVRVDAQRGTQRPETLSRLQRACAEHGFRMWVHNRLTDEEFAGDLQNLDVTVLPYTYGTHSGWVELCRDLGVPVAVSDVGCVAEQAAAPVPGVPADAASGVATFTAADPHSLAAAIDELLARREHIRPATRAARAQQREQIAAVHAEVYNRALARAHARLVTRAQ